MSRPSRSRKARPAPKLWLCLIDHPPILAEVRYQSFLTDSGRWDGFSFRPGDIVISTPAKCGTTWTQMICALLIFQTPDLPASLDLLSPWLEMRLRRRRDVFELYEAQTHRRFIKSHTPLDGLPVDERITYICVGRDPRDVALSWDAHMHNLDFDAFFAALAAAIEPDDDFGPPRIRPTFTDERDAVRDWVDDPTPPEEVAMSLAGLIHHLAGFWAVRDRDDVVLLHYDDLQTDLEGEMRRLADRLDITVPEERWPALVKAATFDEMRSRADERRPRHRQAHLEEHHRLLPPGHKRPVGRRLRRRPGGPLRGQGARTGPSRSRRLAASWHPVKHGCAPLPSSVVTDPWVPPTPSLVETAAGAAAGAWAAVGAPVLVRLVRLGLGAAGGVPRRPAGVVQRQRRRLRGSRPGLVRAGQRHVAGPRRHLDAGGRHDRLRPPDAPSPGHGRGVGPQRLRRRLLRPHPADGRVRPRGRLRPVGRRPAPLRRAAPHPQQGGRRTRPTGGPTPPATPTCWSGST